MQDQKQHLLNNLNIGDIAYCKMPLSKEELQKIEYNHRNRPYIVIQKDDNGFYGYPSSHKLSNSLGTTQYYCLTADSDTTFSLNKRIKHATLNSYFDLSKTHYIPKENIKFRSKALTEKEKSAVEKRLFFQNKLYKKKLPSLNACIQIDVGDLVQYGGRLYYVYNCTNLYLDILPVKDMGDENTIKIVTPLGVKFIDYSSIKKIQRTDSVKLEWLLSEEDILFIDEGRKYFLENHYNKKYKDRYVQWLFKPGSIFCDLKGKEYVYLFHCSGNPYGLKVEDYDSGIDRIEILPLFKKTDMIDVLNNMHLNEVINNLLSTKECKAWRYFLLKIKNRQYKVVNGASLYEAK